MALKISLLGQLWCVLCLPKNVPLSPCTWLKTDQWPMTILLCRVVLEVERVSKMAPLPQRPNVYNSRLPDPKGHQEDSLRYLDEVIFWSWKLFHQFFCTGKNWSGKGNFGAGHHEGHCLGDQLAQVHHSLWSQLLQSRPCLSHQGILHLIIRCQILWCTVRQLSG